MSKKVLPNIWADVVVEYLDNGETKEYGFMRRDFDIEGVKAHCLSTVQYLYAAAGLKVLRFRITREAEQLIVEARPDLLP